MKKLTAALIALSVLLSAVVLSGCSGDEKYGKSKVVLGEAIALSVDARGRGARAAVEEMFALTAKVFDEINLSDDDCVLSRFNSARAGEKFRINSHTYNMLSLAADVCGETSGAFDVTAYPLVKLWKVDAKSINGLHPVPGDPCSVLAPRLPDYREVLDVLDDCGFDKIRFFEDKGKYYLEKTADGAAIDLGGIAKGYFTDLCKTIAQQYSLKSCLINLSGNLYLYGPGIKNGGDWTVGIINPRPRLVIDEALRGHVAALKCPANRAFVSGGDYQRFYYYSYLPVGEVSSEAQLIAVPHIIDPRSGLPVGVKYDQTTGRYYNDLSAVCMAVVSDQSSARCDAYSTAACVLGITEGAALIEARGMEGVILTNPDLPYDGEQKRGAVLETKQGKGKIAVIGQLNFLEGCDLYKIMYDRVESGAQ